jgi:hypothetical protein
MLFGTQSLMEIVMANGLISEKIQELQNEFSKRLIQREPLQKHSVPTLLHRVVECDENLLEFTLGKIGQKLRVFAENVDFQHPEIAFVFDGVIANDQDFAQECMELLILGQFARENNLSKIIPSLGKILTKESLTKNIIKKIDVPVKNRMHVRLLKDFKEREEIRLTKRMQIIDLHSLYKKGDNIWKVQPDNFTKFLRFDTAYQDDLKIAEKKAQRYEELGCISLAAEIRKNIESFHENMEQSYYGFNRITMTSAAIILAKSLGYTYCSSQDSLISSCGKITIDRKFFGKYNFDPEQTIEFSPAISAAAGSPIFTQKIQNPYNYEPRVYPLHELSDILSEDIRNTVNFLEEFPDADNKPIFDHFGIIVPGVEFPFKKQNMYTISDERGMLQTYTHREDALRKLDSILVKGKYFPAILIGERDGKCYFISYFF